MLGCSGVDFERAKIAAAAGLSHTNTEPATSIPLISVNAMYYGGVAAGSFGNAR